MYMERALLKVASESYRIKLDDIMLKGVFKPEDNVA